MTVTVNRSKTDAVTQDEVRSLLLDVSPGHRLTDDQGIRFEVAEIIVFLYEDIALFPYEFVFTIARGEGTFRLFSGSADKPESTMSDAPAWYAEAIARIIAEESR